MLNLLNLLVFNLVSFLTVATEEKTSWLDKIQKEFDVVNEAYPTLTIIVGFTSGIMILIVLILFISWLRKKLRSRW